jgi:heptaprenyl diphosphate synthase
MSPLTAAAVSLLRVVLSSLLFGSFVSLLYSLSGAVLSFVLMLLFKKIGCFSIVGVSVIGGVMHNAGQIICAAIVMGTAEIAGYLPVLVITGTLSGIAVGAAAGVVTKRIEKI